ncbi:DUF4011 domain-containing protein [Bremerella cremea]|uniref:DNA/RNA helicase n=2 Tax=Pirellulales TaxID=2691354 RepID=A0A2S8G7D5_9BACT|nr:DNA/RNA helicase [Blastopirellula marina]RCS51944.1 DUF4011 domain-containing protein [Bremerella cremea]
MTSMNLADEIERFRERLLDLSLRNPLLSYRKSKRRTLQVVNELPDVMYQRLVDDGKPFTLDFVPDPPKAKPGNGQQDLLSQMEQLEERLTGDKNSVKGAQKYPLELPDDPGQHLNSNKHLFDDKLQTNLTQSSLNATIRTMRREADTAMQETGINYLFLAIGFLAWREAESSDKDRMAPLILVPVKIEKVSRGNGEPRFTIQWDEDEVQFNLSLQKKLARDFDLKLPEFSEESCPETYFKEIRSAIRTKQDWSIKREAVLGFFSFHKLSMYADIDPENWGMTDGTFSGGLLEDLVSGREANEDEDLSSSSLYAPDYDIDRNETVEKLWLALDADSSQQSALVDIRSGKNLVIEGPPGTGKSQTITNAIADALGAGKTILFVAEKLAALQVVHDRMAALGLSDFCLELHSDGTSPPKVFQSLGDRLMGDYPRPDNLSLSQQTLTERRKQLNAYVAEMATKAGPENEPLYDLLWRIIGLRDAGAQYVPQALGKLPQDRGQFQHAHSTVTTFAKVYLETPTPLKSPWWGFFPEGFAFRQEESIRAHLTRTREFAQQIRDSILSIVETWSIPTEQAYRWTSNLATEQLRESLANQPSESLSVTRHLSGPEQITQCHELLGLIENQEAHRRQLLEEYGSSPEALSGHVSALEGLVQSLNWDPDSNRTVMRQVLTWFQDVRGQFVTLSDAIELLKRSGIALSDWGPDFQRGIKLVQLIRHSVTEDPAAITGSMFDGSAVPVFRQAKQIHDDLVKRRNQIQQRMQSIAEGEMGELQPPRHDRDLAQKVAEELKQLNLQKATLAQVKEILEWATPAENSLTQVEEMGQDFSGEFVKPAKSFEVFQANSIIVQLARHSAVAQDDCVSEQMFSNEAWNTCQQALKTAEGLKERKQKLESSFHLPSVPGPEEIKSISKALRRGRKSWFKFLDRDFREAQEKLDEFIAVGKRLKLDDCIRALEDLDVLTKDETSFGDDPRLREHLGAEFLGVETDWESLKTRFAWMRKVRQHGFDCERATALLREKSKLLTNVSNQDLRRAETAFADQWLGRDSFAKAFYPNDIKGMPFDLLGRRLRCFIENATQLLRITETVELPKNWTVEQILELAGAWQELDQYEAELRQFKQDGSYKQALGSHFCGPETDWAKLEMAFNWARKAKEFQADFGLCSQLFEHRNGVLSDFDTKKSSECAEKLDGLLEVTPQSVDMLNGLSGKLPDEIVPMLDSQLEAIENGIQATLDLGLNDQVTTADIAQQLELTRTIDQTQASMDDPEKWHVLRDCGVFQEILASPERVKAILAWVEEVRRLMGDLPTPLIDSLLETAEATEVLFLCDKIDGIREAERFLREERSKLESFGRVETDWLGIGPKYVLDGSTEAACEELVDQLDQLPEWSKFCRALQECERLGLEKFCDLVIHGELEPASLGSSYQLTVLESEVEGIFGGSEILRTHSGQLLQGIREEFQSFDKQMRELGKQEIAARAADRPVPEGNSRGRVSELTELSLIRHEAMKQRRHCRIRDLMGRAGKAVQSLKPCFMMSPLSVSRFIPQGTVEFDLVIMDEASQIKPEDAIGTILRSKQLVVVGDPKQLPPTSFFDRLGEEVADEESTQFDNTESVLEASMKVFQPFRRLRWHYRSKHESLIRFSNTQFYDNDLVVFPSPSGDTEQYGIRHVFVEGATCTSGENVREAEAVVEEIVRHALTRPNESLGVGTFNKKQCDLIQELLDKRCEADSMAALAVDQLRELDETLFIKNLENLQGDERDVIFVCYTYGKDPASGRLLQRFGPINSQTGWRRLNVLITRSRHRMVVFSSFMPSDVQGGPDKSRGVNAYREFLQYAVTGSVSEPGVATGRSPDSDFEVAVCRHIEQMGLEAVPQVGVAGFFVDIGVRRRGGDRSFLLGIECDGATYHSAKCARDRDRLREEIIRSRGWEIHRIWSTDWFMNQKAEIAKLEKVVKACL